MSVDPNPERASQIAAVESQFDEAEQQFLALQAEAERRFYNELEKLRTKAPPEAHADLDLAEREFQAEHARASQSFYHHHNQARMLEIGYLQRPDGS